MKRTVKIIIISAVAVVLALVGIFDIVHARNVKKTTTSAPTETTAISKISEETSTTVEAEVTTVSESTTKAVETTVTTQATTKKNNPYKTYYAPNQYEILGDVSKNKIVWNDDNSLRVYKYYSGAKTSKDYYDIKINDYGEVQSIIHTYEVTDGEGNYETVTKEHNERFKYNSKHQVSQEILLDSETGEEEYIYNCYYNSDGLRIKKAYDYQGEEHGAVYEYKDGLLVKSTFRDFYPYNGGDKICTYKYDKNSSGLVTKVYMAVDNPDMDDGSSGDNWEDCQSLTYEKVTKAQYDFFYNTLIYHIIDGNEWLL